ncbi:MAG: hypothetical protein J0M11_19850 [Anaerolineae bacterium]|nr:hypothetical protein [Anaerolineae bacterium]
MKIAIAIFGIPRGSIITSGSLFDNIIRPSQEVGEVVLFGHLFDKKHITNIRSGESGQLSSDDYIRFAEFKPILEEPEICLEKWDFNFFKKFGDLENDKFQSIKNLIHQLHSLYSTTVLIEATNPDVVIYARPDLLYHQPINNNLIELASQNKKRIYIPEWQWWNGYNDRFAICGSEAYKIYGYRLIQAKTYCIQNNVPLHAERLLRFALAKNKLSIRTMKTKASRVRTGNVIKPENFNEIETLGTDSRRLKIELRFLQVLSHLNI